MEKIRVLLIDDHVLVRAGIRALLERVDRVEVVGEAGNGHEAVNLIESLRPDMMLLDLTIPGLSGFEVLKVASEKFPEVRVIVLTMHDQEEYAFQALRGGAAGYLPKVQSVRNCAWQLSTLSVGRNISHPQLNSAQHLMTSGICNRVGRRRQS